MGIYFLTECMDREQLKLKKYNKETGEIRGGLWKAVGWGNTMVWSCESYDNHSETWGEFEVKYPELDDVPETDYNTLYNAINFVVNSNDADFISHVNEYFDMPVVIDYYIFLYVLNAYDSRGKNMYWAVYDKTKDKKITIGVWDLDNSIGQRWTDQWIPNASSPDYPFADNMNLYYRLRHLNADITDWITRHMQYLDNNVFTATTNISYPSVSKHKTDYYNLNGQRINTPQKGIYIWKGKKVKK